jgi:endonuclease/exonuclease/phosphatase family metal-dependent hydrolase
MKIILSFYFFFFYSLLFSQTTLLSWNIENFGRSKSDSEIQYIAKTIKGYDIIALQEVVAGYGGAQAVAKLADELNRSGTKWDYTISNPTSSSAYKTERYAYLWKTAKIKKIGDAWLEKKYHLNIDREPYLCTFEYKEKQFTVVNFHAITKKRQPETEIKYFKFLPKEYPNLHLLFVGDFNCPQSHTVFNPLKKMGYAALFFNQKTSLKQQCKHNNCLASEFDNIFFKTSRLRKSNKGIIPFYKSFNSLKEARKISDHIPIWFEFYLN